MFIYIALKDALLALLICTALVNLRSNRKTMYLSLVFIIFVFILGYDVWKG